ncbi:hypothetical protein [Saccharibacillus alkalitolerans]|uniref:DUF4173 domain-containing protein n=1 Tax=Saccharibacillus alkalitolerans TaxID=2705290 RepID=A0ABX0FBM9_9BACL|nr:hypothetical protein [Saccharibacillus alkalitolerans]NGZ77683.1 hypothetical protein [Saccharibacillus alkalitolerans]
MDRNPGDKRNNAALSVLLFMLPSFLLLFVLFDFFPNTGLGRILSTPATLLVNLLITMALVLLPYRKLWFRIVRGVVVIVCTCWITIAFYPQEFSPPIEEQAAEAVRAIRDIDTVTRNDLVDRARFEDPRYVVALHKYLDEIPFDGSYQLYRHPNTHTDNYTISKRSDIVRKLKGHHKAMWWYMNVFHR